MASSTASGSHPAVRNVANQAAACRSAAAVRLDRLGVEAGRVSEALNAMSKHGRLTLNFHPDRRDSTGRTVAAGLLADGRYRSQFETGISNGGRYAVPGGARQIWESSLFGDAYGTDPQGRPIYGALDLFGDSYGGAARFGSCLVVLNSACFDRATFCVGDSHLAPDDVGTADSLTSILAGALESCADGKGFGRLDPDQFLDGLAVGRNERGSARELDHYVEAQIHGGVDLARDVDAIVLDPSFRATDVAREIGAAAERYRFEVMWNEGSELRPADIDPKFRGPEMTDLAGTAARPDGMVDAASIGRVLDGVSFTPPSVAGDPEDSPRQLYKKLWHCCLEFGKPTQRFEPPTDEEFRTT